MSVAQPEPRPCCKDLAGPELMGGGVLGLQELYFSAEGSGDSACCPKKS